jgi:hypothetical protein
MKRYGRVESTFGGESGTDGGGSKIGESSEGNE